MVRTKSEKVFGLLLLADISLTGLKPPQIL